MPCLLLQDDVFVKTKKFHKPVYIGDPVNTINLFNKFEVDEIILLDIGCVRNNRPPHFSLIADLASECWVPLSYGGGIRSVSDAQAIFNSGIEKIVLDSLLFSNPQEVRNCVSQFGASSVAGCLTVKRTLWGSYEVRTRAGKQRINKPLVDVLTQVRDLGIGELVINDMSRDGTALGYDLTLISFISKQLGIPVISLGGASGLPDFKNAIDAGASAVAAGSCFVFQKNIPSSVLVSYPDRKDLEDLFNGS